MNKPEDLWLESQVRVRIEELCDELGWRCQFRAWQCYVQPNWQDTLTTDVFRDTVMNLLAEKKTLCDLVEKEMAKKADASTTAPVGSPSNASAPPSDEQAEGIEEGG